MEGKLIYPKESYDLVGCAYKIFNTLKYGYHEKYYQRAYAQELKSCGYTFKKEFPLCITYYGQRIGKYYLDFLVNEKIVVELKVANEFYSNHIQQVLAYLKSSGKRLGLLILFTQSGIKYRRIIK